MLHHIADNLASRYTQLPRANWAPEPILSPQARCERQAGPVPGGPKSASVRGVAIPSIAPRNELVSIFHLLVASGCGNGLGQSSSAPGDGSSCY
jgi:hypothetical protein